MSKPTSQKMLSALAAVKSGMTAYAAAKKHGVSQSGISRAMNKAPSEFCPACGSKMKKTPKNI